MYIVDVYTCMYMMCTPLPDYFKRVCQKDAALMWGKNPLDLSSFKYSTTVLDDSTYSTNRPGGALVPPSLPLCVACGVLGGLLGSQ